MAKKQTDQVEGPLVKSAYQFHFKAEDVQDDGTFKGYGSVFHNVDSYDDIVMPGAFVESLEEHQQKGTAPKMLLQHNPEDVIGVWEEIREDDKGLYVHGRLLMDLQIARDTHVRLKNKAIDGLSIGYRVVRKEIDEESGIRKLTAVRLFEVSVVTFPANESARVGAVKTARDLERVLREAGLSRKEAVAVALHGYHGLEERDAPQVDSGLIKSIATRLRELTKQLEE